MAKVTVLAPKPPTVGGYAKMLEELLVEQHVEPKLAHSIANYLEYGAVDNIAFLGLRDRMLDIHAVEAQWNTLIAFLTEMADEVASWHPSTSTLYRSSAYAQEIAERFPALNSAGWRLTRIIEAVDFVTRTTRTHS